MRESIHLFGNKKYSFIFNMQKKKCTSVSKDHHLTLFNQVSFGFGNLAVHNLAVYNGKAMEKNLTRK